MSQLATARMLNNVPRPKRPEVKAKNVYHRPKFLPNSWVVYEAGDVYAMDLIVGGKKVGDNWEYLLQTGGYIPEHDITEVILETSKSQSGSQNHGSVQ